MSDITYQIQPDLSVSAFIDLLTHSGLAERRPVTDTAKIAAMLRGANLIVTARDGDTLVGVARSITDGAYCLYCSDLAVDLAYQGRGIGKALLAETRKAAPEVQNYLLLSAPKAVTFYEAAGFARHENCFLF